MTHEETQKTPARAEGGASAKPKPRKKATKKAATKGVAKKSVAKATQSKQPNLVVEAGGTEEVAAPATKMPVAPESAAMGRELSTGTDGGFIVLLGEDPLPTEPTAEPADSSTAEKGPMDGSSPVGRELSTGTDGGFIVFLDGAADSPDEGERTEKEDRVLDLGVIATINNVADLHTRALLLLKKKGPIEIRAAEVERVDTATLQLLCSFRSEAASQEIELRWDQPSVAFNRAATQLDLQTELFSS